MLAYCFIEILHLIGLSVSNIKPHPLNTRYFWSVVETLFIDSIFRHKESVTADEKESIPDQSKEPGQQRKSSFSQLHTSGKSMI